MVERFGFNKNTKGEITVFDRKLQRSVGGNFKTKQGWFVAKFSGSKARLTHINSLTKAESLKKLKKLFAN